MLLPPNLASRPPFTLTTVKRILIQNWKETPCLIHGYSFLQCCSKLPFLIRTSSVAGFLSFKVCMVVFQTAAQALTSLTNSGLHFLPYKHVTCTLHCFLYQHRVRICMQLYIAKVTAFASKVCFAMLPIPTNGPGIACQPYQHKGITSWFKWCVAELTFLN